MKKISLFIAALVLLVFSSPKIALADTLPIVANNIEATQLRLSYDGANTNACSDGVTCDPGDSLSYVVDVNTAEQRDVQTFEGLAYNTAAISWATPLEVGHTYKVQMHGAGDIYRISQEFTYTAPLTNTPDGLTTISDLRTPGRTEATLRIFSPALPAIDDNCLLNGAADLSIDIYVNNTKRQTVTGNCTITSVYPATTLNFYSNSVFGNGNYYFVVHSASTGNVWTSNGQNYTAPAFHVSNLTLDHATGHYSFNYSGYTWSDVTGESVAIHADNDSWGYNHEPATCTGGSSGSGTCSGTFNYSQGTFSCADTLKVQIYGYHQLNTATSLENPDPSCLIHFDSAEWINEHTFRIHYSNNSHPGETIGLIYVEGDGSFHAGAWSWPNSSASGYVDFGADLPGADMNNLYWGAEPGYTRWYKLTSGTGLSEMFRLPAYNGPPANQAPAVTFTADATTINEGDAFTAHGSFTDPDSTSWTATVDYGDGSGVQPLAINPDHTFSLNHIFVDNGSYTITVSITDNQGLPGITTGSGSGPIVVNNPAPTVPPITPPTNVDQSGPAVINVSFSDYGNQSHTATVNWGDGSGNQSVPVSGNDFSPSHTYQNPGTYTVVVTVTDSQGATTTQTLTITVLNVAPQVGAITFPGTIGVGSAGQLSVNFTDPGTVDTHTATINWGDGTTTNGVVSESSGAGSVTGSHAYATPGNYTITVAVTDDDNGTEQRTASTTAVNQVTALSSAGIWIGLKNSDDVGTKFDLKIEAFKGSTLIASGQLDSFAGGSSGFNNAHLATIPFSSFTPVDVPAGSVINVTVSVRNACVGSGHNSGVARLWYNDAAANSTFGLNLNGINTDYYLRDVSALAASPGVGPKKTVDVQAGAKCSAFKPLGTWSMTL